MNDANDRPDQPTVRTASLVRRASSAAHDVQAIKAQNREARRQAVLDTLAQDAEVIKEARMLPAEGTTLSADHIESVRRLIVDYIDREGVARSHVARQIGVSTSVVSEFLAGKGRGNVEALARKLNAWVEQHTRAKNPDRPSSFVSTAVVERIFKVLRDTQRTGTSAVIFGPAGVSKTMVCQEAATTQIVGSVHIPVNSTCTSASALSSLWCQRLGLPVSGNTSTRFGRIVSALQGSGRLQMFDDAHKMLPRHMRTVHRSGRSASCAPLEFIFDVHDATGAPVVLFGTLEIDNAIGDEQAWAGQLSSRVKTRYTISAAEQSGGRPLFAPDELREFAATLGPRMKLAKGGADFLALLCSVPGFGGLRRARMLLSTALAVATRDQRTSIGEDDLRAALLVSYGAEPARAIEARVEQARKARKVVA